MSSPRTTPAFAVELLKELKLEDLTYEQAFKNFKNKFSIPIMDIINTFLTDVNNYENNQLVFSIRPLSTHNKKIMTIWAKNYFQDIFKMTTKEILATTEFVGKTANELYLLGIAYGCNLGVEIDYNVAFHFYQLSANLEGSLLGPVTTAYLLNHGAGCEKNIQQARQYLSKALALSTIGLNNMAFLLETHFPEEKEEALRNYILSAISMEERGLHNLRICFKQQFCGLDRDPIMEEKLIKASISTGSRENAISNLSQLPYDDRWQYVRLIGTDDTDTLLRNELKAKGASVNSALTYHAAFALKETKDENEAQKLKKAFFDLCDTKPDTVKKLMQELNDSEDDILQMLLDEQQINWLSFLCMHRDGTSFLTPDTFNIVVRYLNFPLFACPLVLKSEIDAKTVAQPILAGQSMFAKKLLPLAMQAAKGTQLHIRQH